MRTPHAVHLRDLRLCCSQPSCCCSCEAPRGWTEQQFGLLTFPPETPEGALNRLKDQLAHHVPMWISTTVRTDVVVVERVKRVIRNGKVAFETILEGGTTHHEIIATGTAWVPPDSPRPEDCPRCQAHT